MNTSRLRTPIGAALVFASAAQSAPAQNISRSINQPGIYGRVDIGEPVPQRAWIHPRPIIIAPPQVVYERQPIYLYVPPQHSNNWGRYCGRYNACAQPVVFVQDSWVRDRHTQYRGGRGGATTTMTAFATAATAMATACAFARLAAEQSESALISQSLDVGVTAACYIFNSCLRTFYMG